MTEQQNLDDPFEPAATQVVTDLEVLKLLSDAMRAQLIDLLRAKVQTVRELAETLNLSPKKLYYHINLLEKHGLIRVVSRRIVSGIIEKSYRTTAYLFLFEQTFFKSSESGEQAYLPEGMAAIIDVTRNQLEQSITQGLIDTADGAAAHRKLLSMWNLHRLSKRQAEDFYQRFNQLFRELNDTKPEPGADEYHNFRIFLTMFPVKAFLESAEEKLSVD